MGKRRLNKEKVFHDILDDCLARLSRGETPAQCLARYPDRAAQLEPLLRTASLARAATTMVPRPESKIRGKVQLREALRESKPRRGFSFLSLMPRWALAVSVFLLLVAGGSGTVAAAGNSMPDGFLYPLKIATERVRLQMTVSDLGKAELYARLADRRITEIASMAEKGKPDKIAGPARRLDQLLVSIAGMPIADQPALMETPAPKEMAPEAATAPRPGPEPTPEAERAPVPKPVPAPRPSPLLEHTGRDVPPIPPGQARLLELLRRYQTDHPEKLRAALKNAPPSLRPLLRRIISRSQASYRQALRT